MPLQTTSDPPSTVNDIDRLSVPIPLLGSIELRRPESVSTESAGQPVVLKWIDPNTRSGKSAIVGIEYDGSRLVLVGVKRTGRNQTIHGFLAADFERTPAKAEISGLLREFNQTRGVRVQVAVAATHGVVRQFPLPPLPKRQRLSAAIWEGQKLIPFPLKAEEALYGFSFAPGPAKNLQVTLVAVPRRDAEAVLAAIEEVGWVLEGVSISGAHRVTTTGGALQAGSTDQVIATALWTPRRGIFVVFRGGQFQFQYDLGPPPALSSAVSLGLTADTSLAADWIREMGRAISDALEFYLGAYPQFAPERLELMGVPEAVAPLVTDWHEGFGVPIVFVDALERFSGGLPPAIKVWIDANTGLLTPAALAASGKPVIDLTPPAFVTARKQRLFSGVARGIFILSAAIVVAWTGLLWMRLNLSNYAAAEAGRDLELLRSSSPAKEMERAAGVLRDLQTITSEVTMPPRSWMPWAKSITSTVPSGAELASLSLDLPENVSPGMSLPVAHLEGRLDPSERPHSLIYADWISRLDHFAGRGASRLVSARTIDWKGSRSSAFVLDVRPPGAAQGAAK